MRLAAKFLLFISALLAISTLARSDGIYNPTAGGMLNFTGNVGGFGGPSNPSGGGGGGGATPCSGTGLIFTTACNSQYIGVL